LEGEVDKVDWSRKPEYIQKTASKQAAAASRSSPTSPKGTPPARAKEEQPKRSPLNVAKESETSKRHSSYAPGTSSNSRKAPRIDDDVVENPRKGIRSKPTGMSSHSTAQAPAPVQPTIIHVPVPVPMYNGMMMTGAYGMPMGQYVGVEMMQPQVYIEQPVYVEQAPSPTPVAQPSKPKKVEPARKKVEAELPRLEPKPTYISPANVVYHNKTEVITKVIREEPKVASNIEFISVDNNVGRGNISSDMVVKDMVISLPTDQKNNASLLVDAVNMMENK
jgi:hypothetical protein